MATATPPSASHSIVRSTVHRPGVTPATAITTSHATATAAMAPTITPAQFTRHAEARSPCITSDRLVVMPHAGQGSPESVWKWQGGSPSCRCVPEARGRPSAS